MPEEYALAHQKRWQKVGSRDDRSLFFIDLHRGIGLPERHLPLDKPRVRDLLGRRAPGHGTVLSLR